MAITAFAIQYIGNINDYLLQYPHLYPVIIFVFAVLISQAIVYIFTHYLSRLASKTATKIDDLIIKRINRPLSLIIIFFGLRLALVPLDFSEKTALIISRGLSTFVIIIATYIVITLFDIVVDGWSRTWVERTKSKTDEQILSLLRRISRLFFGVIGFMFILGAWGIQIGPLLAGLGIAGIAVAFAMQNTLSNIFGGISMIIDKTIKVGDMVRLDENTAGIVSDIGMRSTKIVTFDNEVITIPNGQLANSRVQNIVPPDPSVRLVLPVSVAYGSDIEKVKKTILKAIQNIKNVIYSSPEKAPYIRFIEMGDFALKFSVYIWIDDYLQRFFVKDVANTKIYDALNKANIVIPFPQMDVYIKEFRGKVKK